MLHTSVTYITENTTRNQRNLIDCLGVYSTEKTTKQNKCSTWKPTKKGSKKLKN